MTDTNNPDSTITIAVATEPTTQVFQIGETIADAIAQTKLALLPHFADNTQQPISDVDDISIITDIPHVKVDVVTNSGYLNGWLKKHGHKTRLVDDEGLLNVLGNEDIATVIVVPSVENLAINQEGVSLPPNEDNILVRVQDEILRLDDEGKRIHDNMSPALMLPPEYRMTRSNVDPDTYIRIIATPAYVHLATTDSDSEANKDA